MRVKQTLTLLDTLVQKYFFVIVGLMMAAAFVISLTIGITQSVWFDENYSITLAEQSVAELIRLTSVDAHPPLYYLVLKLWTSLFGFSEIALRSLSATLLAGSIGAAAFLIRKLFSVRIALLALPVLTFAPFLLRFGFEIRMYALVMLIGVLATWVLVKAYQTRSWKWWGLYAVLVALGMYSLYMAATIWLAHLVWLLVQTIRARQPILKQQWVVAYAGAVLLYLPWLPSLLYQVTHSALPGIGSRLDANQLLTLTGITFNYGAQNDINAFITIPLVALISLLVVLVFGVWSKVSGDQKKWLLLLVCLAFVPILFYALATLPPLRAFFMERYLVHTAIFIYILIAVIIGLGWRYGQKKLAAIAYVLLMGLLIGGVFNLAHKGNYNFQRTQNPQGMAVREGVGYCDDETTIVADDPLMYIDTNYYFDGCDLRFFAKNTVPFGGGYAPVHASPARVESSESVSSNRLFHVYVDDNPQFAPDNRYVVIQRTLYDKTSLVEYGRVD